MPSNPITALQERRRTRRRPSAPLLVRTAVWLLFGVLVALGVSSLPSTTDTAPSVSAAPTRSLAVAGPVAGVSAATNDRVLPDACGNLPGSDGVWPACAVTPDGPNYHTDPQSLLPAYRWQGSLQFLQNLGWSAGDGVSRVIGSVSSMMFIFVNFLWGVNLSLINAADKADFLSVLASEINGTFVRVMNSMWGLVALGYLVVLVRMARQIMKGDTAGFIRVLAGFVIPVTFVVSMANAVGLNNANLDPGETGTSSTPKDTAALAAKGTPAWVANEVIRNLDRAGSTLAMVFDPLQSDTSQLGIKTGADPAYECADYVGTLEKSYLAYSSGNDGSGGPTLFVSKMWTLTVFDPWSVAALGDQPARHRGSCHLAELNTRVPASERAKLAELTWGRTFPESLFRTTDRDFGDKTWSEQQWHVAMWQACSADGMEKHWLDAMRAAKGDTAWDGDAHCEAWLANGMDSSSDPAGIDPDVESLYEDTGSFSQGRVNLYYEAVTGHNDTNRMVMGLVSAAGAIIYLWAFAGAAIGVLCAKIGLVLALMILPFTLTLIGIGSQAGPKLLRWTASLCAIDLVFTVVLALLFQITLLGVNAIGGWGVFSAGAGVQAGFMKIALIAVIPIASVLAVNRILKGLGLGKITNPVSAFGLVGRASAKAFNSDTTSGYMRGKAKEGGRNAFEKGKKAVSLGKRAKDPFNTGRTDAKKNAANAVALHKKGLLDDKGRNQAIGKFQLAEAKHEKEKEKVLRGLRTGGLGLLADKRQRDRDLTAGVDEWSKANLAARRGKGEDGDKELAGWRARAAGTGTGSELVDDAAARSVRAEKLNEQAAIAERDSGLPVGELGGHLVHTELAEHAAASRFGDLAGLDTSDLSSLVVPGALRAELIGTAASEMRIDSSQVMMDHFGNAIPDPSAFASMADVPLALRSHPVFHMDPSELGVRPLESQADRATRVTGALVASGYMGVEDGQAVTTAVWGSSHAPASASGRSLWAQLDDPSRASSAAAQLGTVTVSGDGIGAAILAASAAASRIDSAAMAAALRDGLSDFNATSTQATRNLTKAAESLTAATTEVRTLTSDSLSASPAALEQALGRIRVELDSGTTSGAISGALAGVGTAVAAEIGRELGRIGSVSDSQVLGSINDMTTRLEDAIRDSSDSDRGDLESVAAQLRSVLDAKMETDRAISGELSSQLSSLRATIEDRAALAAAQQIVDGNIPVDGDGDVIGAVLAQAMEREQARLDEIAGKVGADTEAVIALFEQAQNDLRALIGSTPDIASAINDGVEGLISRWEAGMHRYSTPSVPPTPTDSRPPLT